MFRSVIFLQLKHKLCMVWFFILFKFSYFTFAPEVVTIWQKYIIRKERIANGLVKSSLNLTNNITNVSKTDKAYLWHTKFKNLYNHLKRTAKHSDYIQQNEKYENGIKLIWEILSSLLVNSNDKTNICNTFKYNNEVLCTPNDIKNVL
jgi:hypothetical protein